jgi:TatD DNase family protein
MIDTHAHMEDFENPRETLNRAFAAGVEAVAAVGMNAASSQNALDLAGEEPRVWPAVGLHPWEVKPKAWKREVTFVENHLDQASALGEVGLDYKIRTPRALQREALAAQLALAAERDLFALVHCRFSELRTLDMLADAGVRGVFHWFTGPLQTLKLVLDQGHYISATPSVATSPRHREAVAACPLDSLLLETDSPVPHGGRPSEPARVVESCQMVAELKGIDPAEAARVTSANARLVFNRS